MAPYTAEKEMRVGYSVDDGRNPLDIDPRLPLLQDAHLRDKVVLLRVDHNVVKKGKILDQYRIDVTLATMYNIVERGGRPIIMTHVGRPYDKKTKSITVSQDDAVDSVVAYLQRKLRIRFAVPKFHATEKEGILDIDTSINWLINDLRNRKIGGIYLPNTRWFAGEEDKQEKLERFVVQLAGLADVFVNDAFGSWQPHGSTYHIAKHLPSYAGLCMQDELFHVQYVLNPSRPFVAIVAGAKYDTKIGPLTQIYNKVDKLLLGGIIYNTYLCAKYGVKIAGVQDSDIQLAKELVEQDRLQKKIVEMNVLVETDTLDGRFEGQYRTVNVQDFAPGQTYKYIVDVDPASFDSEEVSQALNSAKTIFVNAVMGLMPHFWHGTSKMDEVIDKNCYAQKFFGGGDTLQTFKSLHPNLYQAALDDINYYLFTGGGTVLWFPFHFEDASGEGNARAAGLFQMPPSKLNNWYYLVRSGESEFESKGIIKTNPVAKTSIDSGLSEKGKKQAVKAALELKAMGACEGNCWIWPSITQRAYQAAEIIASVNNVSRSRIVPEYSFLDARGLGAYEGRRLKFIDEVYASDLLSPNLRPPPFTDGTPNESVTDVFVRVTQLMSILETQYSSENVIIVSPDSDNLTILQAGLTGLDLRRHVDLSFSPGEVRLVDISSIPAHKQPPSGVFKCLNPPSCT